MREKHSLSFGSSPPIQYFPLRSCHVSCAISTLISTFSGSLLTTSPTATSNLLFGLATYGFLAGSGGLLGGNLWVGSGGGRSRYDGRRAPLPERETKDAFEGVGETARLVWLGRGGSGCDGSNGVLLPSGLLELGLETVEDRLVVRCPAKRT
ncbi:hypothetical protein BC826DRAFT_470952 [Russula brevipes]|nr:hypothetical protein BC826DRAFT_470952 [Russula brevipes]